MMYRSDKIKLIVAISLFSIIGYFYFTEGKTETTKWVVGICAAIWVVTMIIINKRK